jgi:hypothetical protein
MTPWKKSLRGILSAFPREDVQALLGQLEDGAGQLVQGVNGVYRDGLCELACPAGWMVWRGSRGEGRLPAHQERTQNVLYPMGPGLPGENEFVRWWDTTPFNQAVPQLAQALREYLGV